MTNSTNDLSPGSIDKWFLKKAIEAGDFQEISQVKQQLNDQFDQTLLDSLFEAEQVSYRQWLNFVFFAQEHSIPILPTTVINIVSRLLFSQKHNDPELIKKFIQEKPYCNATDVITALSNSSDISFSENVLDVIRVLSPAEQIALLKKLMPVLIEKGNVFLIHLINSLLPVDEFQSMAAQLNTEEQEIIKDILAIKDEQALLDITGIMSEFTYGFGNLGYNGALAYCAAMSARKSYQFMPTVLEVDQVEEYFKTLKNGARPIRERFVIAGIHWVTGDIKIDENGNASMLIIDSLGSKDFLYEAPRTAFSKFASLFPDQKIYFSTEKRQHARLACGAFSLDDLLHLYTVEHYLKEDLFDYLAKQKDPETMPFSFNIFQNIDLILCHLPPSINRTMQSNVLFTLLKERRQEKAIVDKKNQTALQAAEEDFQIKPGKDVKKNLRLHDKLKKMAKQLFSYLLKTKPDDINSRIQSLRLDGFKKRMAERVEAMKSKTSSVPSGEQDNNNNNSPQQQPPKSPSSKK